ncbi:hypothetical protein VPH35_049713 [Triticum aestivum]|uniref:uncharacterized protein n=1 Tax=Triticum aestivum TaxID=4565 RepID=UPI0008456D5C|nr:uncharacterized protein LOC123064744 [Triticum aestivum]
MWTSSAANHLCPPAVAAASATVPDQASPWPWASLHADLVRLVGWRVLAEDLLDYVRFRAVCTHWRFSTVCPRGRGIVDPRFHPGRWMVLPEGHGLHPDDKAKRRLFSLSTGVSVCPRLPEDYCILDSVNGILLLQRRQQQHDQGSIRLFNPFTGDIGELPPLGSVVSDSKLHLSFDEISSHVVPGGVVTSLIVSSDGAAAVMIWLVELSRVIFATTKDRQWSQSTRMFIRTRRPISFQGKLYILCYDLPSHALQVLQMGPPVYEHGTTLGLGSSFLPTSKLIATCPTIKMSDGIGLAECDSEILVIAYKDSTHTHMVVYRVPDLMLGKVIPVTDIGSKSVFFDTKTSMQTANSGVIPTIASDTIVLRRHHERCHPWQYHLDSGTWSPTAHPMSQCGFICHIYDCCGCTLRPRAGWTVRSSMTKGSKQL